MTQSILVTRKFHFFSMHLVLNTSVPTFAIQSNEQAIEISKHMTEINQQNSPEQHQTRPNQISKILGKPKS